MIDVLNRKRLAAAIGAAGAAVLLLPVALGLALPSAGAISGNVIGVVMMLTAVGIGYGNLALWSAVALGAGAWTLIAPVALGFYDGGTAFWTHMAAGFAWLLGGLAGHELIARTERDAHAGRCTSRGRRRRYGAGSGNRTRITSLEG
jgi:hypothetical protein